MQKRLCSDSSLYIYLPGNPPPQRADYIIFRAEIDIRTYPNAIYSWNGHKKLILNARDMDKACHAYFMDTGKKLVMNCYKFSIYYYVKYIHQHILFLFSTGLIELTDGVK